MSTTISTMKNVNEAHVGEISVANTDSDDAHEERRDDGPAEAPEPAEDDDRQGPRDQVVVAAGIEREHDPEHRARRGRRGHGDAEADRPHARGVDPEQLRRRRVLHRRTDRAAQAGLAQHDQQPDDDQRRDGEAEQPHDRDPIPEDRQRIVGVAGVGRPVGRLVDEAEDPLDAECDRPRDEQRELLALVGAQRAQEQQLQPDAEQEHHRRHDQDRYERVDAELREQRVADERPEDDHRPLCDVDDPHDAERQRQAAGHQRIHASGQQPEDARLDEQVYRIDLPSGGGISPPSSASA